MAPLDVVVVDLLSVMVVALVSKILDLVHVAAAGVLSVYFVYV
jgi:hypothetical protein